jgi:HK97 family phage major capsid protein
MNYNEVKALRAEAVKLNEQAAEILRAAAARPEGERELTAEELEKHKAMHAEINSMMETVETEERQILRTADLANDPLAQSRGRLAAPADGDPVDPLEERSLESFRINTSTSDVLNRWVRGGTAAMSEAERTFYPTGGKRNQPWIDLPFFAYQRLGDQLDLKEVRAQSVGTDSEGGYMAPEGFFNSLTQAMLDFGGIRRSRVTVLRTNDGNKLPMPTVDDTSNTGELLGENAEVSELDVTFSEKVLDAYKYSSKAVRVSTELEEDSAFDIGPLMGRLLGERLGRITNQHHTTGTGTAQPNGIVTASAEGKEAASASVITYLEMIDLKHSVDPAYRSGAEWMFNDSLFSAIKQLLDADNRPLWRPDIAVGVPSTIDGDRYIINQDMASIAASAKVMLYGDLSTFYIRDVRGIRLLRLVERYAEFDQVGYMAFIRTDSELLNAGTNPVKHYVMAAS